MFKQKWVIPPNLWTVVKVTVSSSTNRVLHKALSVLVGPVRCVEKPPIAAHFTSEALGAFSRWRKYGDFTTLSFFLLPDSLRFLPHLLFFPSFHDGNGGLFLLFVFAFSSVNSCIFHAVLLCCDFRHWAALWQVVALRSGFCQSTVRSASDQFQRKGPTLWSHCIHWLVFTLCFVRRNYYVRRGRKSEGSRHTGQQDEAGKKTPESIGSCHFILNCFQSLNHQMLDVLLQGSSI